MIYLNFKLDCILKINNKTIRNAVSIIKRGLFSVKYKLLVATNETLIFVKKKPWVVKKKY
ncbi:MAG TPA: hypothetical protein DEH02_02405 [Bacteroidales bacterium]|nr:MAG: hypothetical protein A2X01_10610 [Bacteroidetes bacterium GWF2_35_48]HBX49899.1 hypothetical protein [Bacteroidales bacterium]